jgi:sulfoxide reductase heme-binding subunit YedZ
VSASADYWRRRLARHAAIAAAAGLAVGVVYAGVPTGFALRKWNLATGYVGLALLAVTLLVGPWNTLRGKPNPVSQDLRRDLGIWTAILALAHTWVGLQVHMQGQWRLYFTWPAAQSHPFPLRTDGFGLANWTGLGSTLVFVLLLALSNDLALRTLGTARWKALQRWNYAGALLLVVHAVIYQVMEKRALYVVAAFTLVVLVTAAAQAAGFRKRRRERLSAGS